MPGLLYDDFNALASLKLMCSKEMAFTRCTVVVSDLPPNQFTYSEGTHKKFLGYLGQLRYRVMD